MYNNYIARIQLIFSAHKCYTLWLLLQYCILLQVTNDWFENDVEDFVPALVHQQVQ